MLDYNAPMPTFSLTPHADTPCDFIRAINVQATRVSIHALRLEYRAVGDVRQLAVPESRLPARTDGLWRDTCFEIFLRPAHGAAYQEFNFSPSGEWAAYSFTAHRHGMTPLDVNAAPRIACRETAQQLEVVVEFESALLAQVNLRAALCAVIKLKKGSVSYWALAHASGKPDFHAEAGFAATGLGSAAGSVES